MVLQGHDSFRVCVGQSCAEFAMHLLRQRLQGQPLVGVQLPEQLALQDSQRRALLDRLVSTPGTLTYRVRVNDKADVGIQSTETVPTDV